MYGRLGDFNLSVKTYGDIKLQLKNRALSTKELLDYLEGENTDSYSKLYTFDGLLSQYYYQMTILKRFSNTFEEELKKETEDKSELSNFDVVPTEYVYPSLGDQSALLISFGNTIGEFTSRVDWTQTSLTSRIFDGVSDIRAGKLLLENVLLEQETKMVSLRSEFYRGSLTGELAIVEFALAKEEYYYRLYIYYTYLTVFTDELGDLTYVYEETSFELIPEPAPLPSLDGLIDNRIPRLI